MLILLFLLKSQPFLPKSYFKVFIGVYLFYNAVLVSPVQQSE